ncbi:MAG: type II secretion system F family protein [Selenomonadaceae bacterium]|nr:type II secretion system F family protein [Selenomonadaceae bacterium]
MQKFKYKGYDARAVVRTGTLEAQNYSEAYAALAYQGITVVTLNAERVALSKLFSEWFLHFQIGERWLSIFFRELSVMVGTMNLFQALQTLAKTAQGSPSEKILNELATAIGEGAKFSDALGRHEIIFSGDVIQTIAIAEESGNTQEVLKSLAAQMERVHNTKRQVSGAMYYPLVVIIAAMVAAVVMMNVTLPVFANFYRDNGGELPFMTYALLHGGKFLTDNLIFVTLGFFFVVLSAFLSYYRIDAVKFFVDKIKLNLRLFREIELRNLFGRLSFLLESGITLDQAMKMISDAGENLFLKQRLSTAQNAIEHGESLEKVLRGALEKISPLYLGLIATGEATGEIVTMLRQCEELADFEITEILRGLPAKAEVYGTLAAGVIVGALVFAVMLPIFNMTTLNL